VASVGVGQLEDAVIVSLPYQELVSFISLVEYGAQVENSNDY
jgi:hypothetical protein